ncbi:MAG TPA: penicillin acylase family protein, partial [Thermomicrobiales bacterium]|nr:penicillin acylase family protein [Thermomicrobiales bacterium]
MAETIDRQRLERALHDTSGTVSVRGLDQPVEIVRDSLGIPHVRAASLRDAFFGQGFAHAQDRLWQMVFDRARAAGRGAALAGRTLLDSDILMRRLDLVASARADYEAFDDDTRTMLDAYTAGVNAFIDTTATLPVELDLLGVTPEPWQPWDAGAIFKVRHVLMGAWGSKLWRARILAALGPEAGPPPRMRGG